jgi:hypothetical protein
MSPDRSTAPSGPPAPAVDERTMARNDAEKDFAPAPPPAESRPAAAPSLQKATPRKEAVHIAPEPRAQAPSGERDQPMMRQAAADDSLAETSRHEAGAAAAVASGASAGGPGDMRAGSWPVRIEAPPYHVLLTAENEMIVSQGESTCAVAIDPADGRRLVRMARAETALFLSAPATASAAPAGAPPPDGATKSAAKQTAPATAAAPPGETTVARPISPAGETAIQLIRGRYRAQIEEHCVHVLP